MNRYFVPVVGISALAVAGLLSYAKTTGQPLQKPAAAAVLPMATNSSGYMSEATIDGKDVVQLLNLQAYKWKVSLPKKANSMVLWAEEWHKGAKQPKIYGLGTMGLMMPHSTADNFLIKLPDARDPRFTTIFGGNSVGIGSQLVIDNLKGSRSISPAPSQKLTLEKDVLLVDVTQNRSGSFHSSEKLSDIIKNDRTILYKMRLTSRNSVMPVWKNGHIILSSP